MRTYATNLYKDDFAMMTWGTHWNFAAGAQNSPAVTDPTVGEAYLLISFNTASNNITYQLTANNITEIMAAHIHVNAAAGANGSVAIPLYQSPFVALPNATTTGLIAANALTPAVFVGPLEVLPDYTNTDVPTVLSQYITPGLAYAQVMSVLCWQTYFRSDGACNECSSCYMCTEAVQVCAWHGMLGVSSPYACHLTGCQADV